MCIRDSVDGDRLRSSGQEGAVLVDQVDGDGAAGRAVGVGVRDVAARRVGAVRAIAPVDDVAAHRLGAGVRHRTQRQRVGRAFGNVGVAIQRDGRRDVVDGCLLYTSRCV